MFFLYDQKPIMPYRRQNVISFYQPEVWLRMRFKTMPSPTRDVLWIEVATILAKHT